MPRGSRPGASRQGDGPRPTRLSDVSATICRVTQKPEPREVKSWQAAEANAAAWMRHWGFPDAGVTESGRDGGIDVRATGALAQVKREAKPVGRPAVQNLVGARGRDASLHLFFFSLSGYSQTAFEYAAQIGIALFQYDRFGSMTGVNARARRIVDRAREPVPTIEAPGEDAKVMRMFDPEDVAVCYFRATISDFTRAILQMHRMGSGGEKRAVTKDRKTTIAPGWLKEYAGLVSLTAEVKYVVRGEKPVVRVEWSSYSNATPETVERVTDDAEAAMERAIDILAQLLGSPIAKPSNSEKAGRRG
jgi:hypothetical protein